MTIKQQLIDIENTVDELNDIASTSDGNEVDMDYWDLPSYTEGQNLLRKQLRTLNKQLRKDLGVDFEELREIIDTAYDIL